MQFPPPHCLSESFIRIRYRIVTLTSHTWVGVAMKQTARFGRPSDKGQIHEIPLEGPREPAFGLRIQSVDDDWICLPSRHKNSKSCWRWMNESNHVIIFIAGLKKVNGQW